METTWPGRDGLVAVLPVFGVPLDDGGEKGDDAADHGWGLPGGVGIEQQRTGSSCQWRRLSVNEGSIPDELLGTIRPWVRRSDEVGGHGGGGGQPGGCGGDGPAHRSERSGVEELAEAGGLDDGHEPGR